MTPPRIDKLTNTGDALIATIDGQDVRLVTFRESLIRQSKVPLPPPFWDRCEPLPLLNDPDDDKSHMKAVEGCIHDPEVAKWMGQFCADTLPIGCLREGRS